MSIINNLKTKNDIQIKYHKLVVAVILITSSFPTLNSGILNFILFSLVISSLFIFILTDEIKINGYLIWALLVGIFISLSLIWTTNLELALGPIKQYIITVTFFIYISFLIKTKSDFIMILKLFVFSRIIMALYIIIFIDFTTLGDIRIGSDNLGDNWNPNVIGMNLAFSSFSVLVLLKEKTDLRMNIVYIIEILLFSIIIFLTGSKKALFILIFSMGLFGIFSSKNNKLQKVGFVLFISIIIFYFIMNIPLLYDSLGNRIEKLIASVIGEETDISTEIRMNMIKNGFDFFIQQPFTGYGINNFSELFGNISGYFTYSHNNYIELLVGIGLFGTIIYYSGHIYILWKSISNKDVLAVFSLVSILTILVLDTGLVSYNSLYIHFFICLAYSSISLRDK